MTALWLYIMTVYIRTFEKNICVSILPGASVRNSTHGKGHEEGGSALRKGEIEPQETPCS